MVPFDAAKENSGTVFADEVTDGNSYVRYEDRGTVQSKVFDKVGRYVPTAVKTLVRDMLLRSFKFAPASKRADVADPF